VTTPRRDVWLAVPVPEGAPDARTILWVIDATLAGTVEMPPGVESGGELFAQVEFVTIADGHGAREFADAWAARYGDERHLRYRWFDRESSAAPWVETGAGSA
jgi:hypothetical protein